MIQRPFQMEATDKKKAVMNDNHSRAVGSQDGVEYTSGLVLSADE